MKKFISIFILIFLTGGSTFAKDLKLICTVDDNSYYDLITFFGGEDKKNAMILFLNERFFATGDVVSSSSSYSINGNYTVLSNGEYLKIGVFRYLINRSTGFFESVIKYDSTNETIVSKGYCRENQPKF